MSKTKDTEDSVPLCKDCHHYNKAEHMMSAQFDICHVRDGEAREVDLVRGEVVTKVHYCVSERDDLPGRCGPSGLLFVKKGGAQ